MYYSVTQDIVNGEEVMVMYHTDGKPSFLFRTNELVLQLKDKYVKLFFLPVTEFRGKELNLMEKWASRPWATKLVHVLGWMR